MKILESAFALSVCAALLLAAASASPCDAAEKLTSKSVPVQIRLAEELAANEDWDETARRWIEILYYFGRMDTTGAGRAQASRQRGARPARRAPRALHHPSDTFR